jgi:ribosomal protein S18 acetylase RimI-like enzyme
MTLERGPALDAADAANKAVHLGWIQERTTGMHVFADDELMVVDSGLPTETFNVVCRARLSHASVSARVSSVLRHFRSANRPFAWWVGPADRPQDLGKVLIDHGLVAAGTEPGMAAALDALREVDLAPNGLSIERVRTARQVQEFAEALASLAHPPRAQGLQSESKSEKRWGWGGSAQVDVLRFYERATPSLLAADSPFWLYVGYLEGEPVATAQLVVGGGIVGLYNIATAAAHRRKGIGSAMTARPLLDARQAGFRTAVLQASEDGFPIYSRLGFEVTGSFTEYHPVEA